ncbi:unnamed protein product [Allacma fusca]|uniref:Retrovirus-related Pol polyprotein from transposon TNT 1-94-like beta-barrel domain-containing protein n=1 Tax=Allacma fusca TaxID=39272 RepID=A0A8J2LBP0_9HEXA|nr:unnamed protein product [Allacma fusca]
MEDHCNSPVRTMCEIQNLAAQLGSVGTKIDDDAIIARVISSLMSERFRQFREAWRSVDSTQQTSALLLSRLKTWELEHEESNGSKKKTKSSKAFSANQNGGNKPRKTKEEIAQLKKTTKYHNCQNIGHLSRECPDKKKHQNASNGQNSNANQSKQQHASQQLTKAYMVGESNNAWVNDSGATSHCCGRLDWYTDYVKFLTPSKIEIANGTYMLAEGVVKIKLQALISGFEVTKGKSNVFTFYNDGQAHVQAVRKNGLHIKQFRPIEHRILVCVKPITWHERLAHINVNVLRATKDKQAVYGLEDMQLEDTAYLVHAVTESFRGSKYYLLVKDEESSFRQVYYQSTKNFTYKNVIDACTTILLSLGELMKNRLPFFGWATRSAELLWSGEFVMSKTTNDFGPFSIKTKNYRRSSPATFQLYSCRDWQS